ncbi:MAG: spore cortex biosynthesis protein YabQ [Oscillospiraceae bacterium]|nr:spore cortex biosynthesis protein YabQ [Oscillospiraceae bacterium]
MIYTTDIIGDQWIIFLGSLRLGMILGGCYDSLRVLRVFVRFGKKAYIAGDFLYCVWAGFLVFSFLLNENFGIPRFYIFFGAAVGFCIWYFTAGKITVPAAKFIKKLLSAILRPFVRIFRNILKFAGKRMIKAKIISAKALNKPKSLLKNKAGMVYNVLCLNILKAFSFCGEKAGKEPEGIESSGTEKNKQGIFPEDCSCCIRGVSSFLTDIHAGGHQRKEE